MKWEIEKRTKEVFNMGGVSKNIRDVKRLLTKQNTLAKKLAVLNTQLMYHKKVLKTKVHVKKLFAFSVQGKSCSVSVLHKHWWQSFKTFRKVDYVACSLVHTNIVKILGMSNRLNPYNRLLGQVSDRVPGYSVENLFCSV